MILKNGMWMPGEFWVKWLQGFSMMFYLIPLENPDINKEPEPCAFEQWDGIDRRCGEALNNYKGE